MLGAAVEFGYKQATGQRIYVGTASGVIDYSAIHRRLGIRGRPVSYTHLDVYKRQYQFHSDECERALRGGARS